MPSESSVTAPSIDKPIKKERRAAPSTPSMGLHTTLSTMHSETLPSQPPSIAIEASCSTHDMQFNWLGTPSLQQTPDIGPLPPSNANASASWTNTPQLSVPVGLPCSVSPFLPSDFTRASTWMQPLGTPRGWTGGCAPQWTPQGPSTPLMRPEETCLGSGLWLDDLEHSLDGPAAYADAGTPKHGASLLDSCGEQIALVCDATTARRWDGWEAIGTPCVVGFPALGSDSSCVTHWHASMKAWGVD